MSESVKVYVGLGSNLGQRRKFIDQSLELLQDVVGVEVRRVSKIVETHPLENSEGGLYLNCVAELETVLGSEKLYRELVRIEDALGRERNGKWTSRTIDIDILLYGDEVIRTESLTVPHSQMHLRSFVLRGLCELNSELKHPVLDVKIGELFERLKGGDFVIDDSRAKVVSVAGVIGVGKTTLARELARELGSEIELEPYNENPFMQDAYAGRQEVALDSQLYFLTHRAEQLSVRKRKANEVIVTDYVFDKDLIYARRTLDSIQLDLYERIYPVICDSVVKPAVTIYLADSAEACLERIHRRNRPYEQEIELSFLKGLEGDYEAMFGNWKKSPVIKLEAGKFDCFKKDDMAWLIKQVQAYTVREEK